MSATDELRHMLDERGVEYSIKDSAFRDITYWPASNRVVASYSCSKYSETENGMFKTQFTPEQAIAATLGDKRDRTEEWLLNACNQAAADYIAELERKLEAATLGGGKLTAEQVREAISENAWEETSTLFEFGDSSWQAIADELNATLGGGECECEGTIEWKWTVPTTYYQHELSCGHVITSMDNEPPNFCEECGAKIRKAVKR